MLCYLQNKKIKISILEISLLSILLFLWFENKILAKPSIEIISAKNYYVKKSINGKVLNFEPDDYNMLVYVKRDNTWKIKHINKYSPYVNIDNNNQFQIKFGIEEYLINEVIIYILPKPAGPWSPDEIIKNKSDLMGIAVFYNEVYFKPLIKPYILIMILFLINSVFFISLYISKNNKFKNKLYNKFNKLNLKKAINELFKPRNLKSSITIDNTEYYTFGNIKVNFNRHEVFRKNELVALNNMQFKLLKYLIANEGSVLNKQKILDDVWGEEVIISSHTLAEYIHCLRNVIEDNPNDPKHIITKHSYGYVFVQHP
ncbi:winged helix-turn-helix domain-containing protein [bacterium]|nr:winged helix-turn-helix domain-containing protein [bacterium]